MIEWEGRLGKTRYLYEVKDDFTGQVEITRINSDGETKLWVPAEDLLHLVAQWIRHRLIRRVGKMNPRDLFDRMIP